MLKFLIAVLLCSSLACQTKDIWYPKEYGRYPGNFAIAPSYSENGSTIGIVIRKLEAGRYNSITLRPSFREFEERGYPEVNWDLMIECSTQVLAPELMDKPNMHNFSTYTVCMERKIVRLPAVHPRFPDGGLDAIITEVFYPPIMFDRPFNVPIDSSACITLGTVGRVLPYHFFDGTASYPNLHMVEASRSTFRNTICSTESQTSFTEDWVNIQQKNGVNVFTNILVSSSPLNFFCVFLSGISQTIEFQAPDGKKCFSMIDFANAMMITENYASTELPIEVSTYRIPLLAQQFAWGSFSPTDWYVGPVKLLVAPPLLAAQQESRMLTEIFVGESNWYNIFFLLRKE